MTGKKVIRKILVQLQDVRRDSTMKTADFDDKLKAEIKLWMRSWISDPLDRVIKMLINELEKGRD